MSELEQIVGLLKAIDARLARIERAVVPEIKVLGNLPPLKPNSIGAVIIPISGKVT